MRLIGLMIGGMIAGAMIPAAAAQEIQGQLAITRTLTRQRVVLPAYTLRGVSPHKHDAVATPVSEWERVVVYLKSDKAPTPAKLTATLNQTGQTFDPEILVVPVGSTVSFPNSDPIFHNVFSLSRTRQFDLGNYPSGKTRTVTFEKSGVVQVFCHLHPDMSATILVVPNAWYARPDANGTFTFSGISSGTYEVVVWHKSAGTFSKRIQVSQDKTAKVSMEIPLGPDELKP
jgi:plastocyanin